MKITIPEELGGGTFRIREHITHSISRHLRQAQSKMPKEYRPTEKEKVDEAYKEEMDEKRKNWLYDHDEVLEEINLALLEMIIEPKLSEKEIDDLPEEVFDILLISISEHIEPQMSEERVVDLKKKVPKPSD